MKKKFLFVGLCLSLVLAVSLTACSGFKSKGLSSSDAIGMGAVSSVKLLGSNMSTMAVKSFSSLNSVVNDTQNTNAEDAVKEQVENFNKYFSALDSFLGEDIVSTKVAKNPDSKYPYETKMTINGKDFNGKNVEFTMYYNETFVKAEDDGEEQESEYQLKGIMVIDEVEYYLEGERSEETEKDEKEDELRIRAYADVNDKSTYIQMEQEISVEAGEKKTEYVYSIYQNGILVEQTAVEFEVEQKNKKTETQFELEFRNGSGRGKYSVEKEEKDNRITFKVKYNINGKTGVFHIREITDDNNNKVYEYSFSDGSKQRF